MSTIILDTLEFATKLKAGGFTEQQAETQARAIAEIVEKQLATRQDVEAWEADLKRDIHESENRLEVRIKELEISLRKDIEVLRAEVKRDIAETKAELIRWVVGVGILQLTIITALLLKLANQL
ncbi:MAG: hypothetical protein DM484_08630 [Candidatus Methylumidiphilus alinenensis]|uniref:DUF1640 domain-containing protein n=1 Tax=Candidatus Methylumidiphilus alinenensis TaxID=2202197 RepID=A0A2W4RBB0_9GAMM|nr:MAG: hypothetical protein DM484_08630 [Candidatus Methylumidiphilus alinenensis]